MNLENLIPLHVLSIYYKVDVSFFSNLNEIGLIEISTIEQSDYIHQDSIIEIEKIIRLHNDLDMNIEGIDVVLNLLKKIDDLQNELNVVKNKLRLYEKEV